MTQGIYKIQSIDGKVYVGSAISIENRIKVHFSELKHNKHRNNKLQNAYNKYGKNHFIVYVVEIVYDKNMLLSREQYYLDMLWQQYDHNSFYNLTPTAGSSLGVKHTDETRHKMSLAARGKVKHAMPHTEESKQKMSEIKSTKTYKLISPKGNIHIIKNLCKFCREHNLNIGNMSSVINGKRKSCQGWRSAEQYT